MSRLLTIDTLAHARSLREADTGERLAEAIASGLSQVDVSDLATKRDLTELRAELRRETAEPKADLLGRMWAMQFATVGLAVGLTVALLRLLPA